MQTELFNWTGNNMNKQQYELKAVLDKMMPEFAEKFTAWNDEYASQERDLGAVGEMVNLWRKAKKAKAAVIDGADTSKWREPLRVVLFEIIGHAFLMLCDLDKEHVAEQQEALGKAGVADEGWAPDIPVFPNCGFRNCIEHDKVPRHLLTSSALRTYEHGHGH